jgi:hypothetical protein
MKKCAIGCKEIKKNLIINIRKECSKMLEALLSEMIDSVHYPDEDNMFHLGGESYNETKSFLHWGLAGAKDDEEKKLFREALIELETRWEAVAGLS